MFGFGNKRTEEPKLDFQAPTLGELVELYAELSESADPEAISRIIKSATDDPIHNICIIARLDNKLVGFLRAWKDTDANNTGTAPGVVLDIVVNPHRRGEKIAKRLVNHLTTNKPAQWKGDSRRVAPNLDRHLAVVRILYAVALTFGYQKVVEATYIQFLHPYAITPPGTNPTTGTNPPFFGTGVKLILTLLFASLGFLGIRLFWATGNIRRYVLRQIIFINPPKTLYLIIFHFPMLFLHAVFFFFLCRFYQDICSYGLNELYVRGMIFVFVCLLFLNVVWLCFLRTGPKNGPRPFRPPESTWLTNNLIFGAVSFVFLASLPCYRLFSNEINLLIVTVLILGNSGLNFIYTGRNYILGDAFGGA